MKELDKLKKKLVLLSKDNNHVMDRIERDLSYLSEEWISLINESLNKIVVLRPDGSGSPARHVKDSHYHPLNKCVFLSIDMIEGELIHELGHVIEYNSTAFNNDNYLLLLNDLVKDKDIASINISFDYSDKSFDRIYMIKDNRFVSEYQGNLFNLEKTNLGMFDEKGFLRTKAIADYFSEGFREYFMHPHILEKKDYPLYNFIKELI